MVYQGLMELLFISLGAAHCMEISIYSELKQGPEP